MTYRQRGSPGTPASESGVSTQRAARSTAAPCSATRGGPQAQCAARQACRRRNNPAAQRGLGQERAAGGIPAQVSRRSAAAHVFHPPIHGHKRSHAGAPRSPPGAGRAPRGPGSLPERPVRCRATGERSRIDRTQAAATKLSPLLILAGLGNQGIGTSHAARLPTHHLRASGSERALDRRRPAATRHRSENAVSVSRRPARARPAATATSLPSNHRVLKPGIEPRRQRGLHRRAISEHSGLAALRGRQRHELPRPAVHSERARDTSRPVCNSTTRQEELPVHVGVPGQHPGADASNSGAQSHRCRRTPRSHRSRGRGRCFVRRTADAAIHVAHHKLPTRCWDAFACRRAPVIDDDRSSAARTARLSTRTPLGGIVRG